MSSEYIKKIRTEDGDKQIDYEALANLPTIPSKISDLENDSNFLTNVPDEYAKKVDYYTKTESDNKYQSKGNYLTEHQSLAGYAKIEDIPTDYAKSDHTHNQYLTQHQDLSDYAKKATTLAGYGITDGATKEEVNALKNYVTPQMYGAVGDGVADDTQAINSALASGKNVFFPVGTYKVTAPLIVPYGIILSGASGLSTIKTYITDGYVFKSEESNNLESLNLENLKFENGNTQDATTRLASGNFIYDASALYMNNCRVYNYYDVFYQIHANSYIVNCRFTRTYHLFCHISTDSVIDGCYINASRYSLPYKAKVFDGSFNSTSLTNCLIDYFFDVFAVTSSASGSVTGNMFNRCVNVFHDHLKNMTIVGNMFTQIRRDEVDLSVLTAEQIAGLEAEKWCIIKFDNDIYTSVHLMQNVIFANNMGFKCENYIYVADGAQVVPALCEFRGNQISKGGSGEPSTVDVGFRNTQDTINAYNSMHNVFFDFWDMKEYATLPSANLIGNGAKSVFSFPYMKAIHNGDIYTNIDGEWVKDGGEVEIPDLSGYVTDDDLEVYIKEEEFLTEMASLKAQGFQQTYLFVNSIEECTDKTKMYVLPDGYIYGYMITKEEVSVEGQPKFTNLKDNCYFNYGNRYSLSGGGYKAVSGSSIVIPVPSEATDIKIYTKGISRHTGYSVIYAGTSTESFTEEVGSTTGVNADENGVCVFKITKSVGMTYVVFTIVETNADAVAGAIVTVDEPIEYKTGTEIVTKEGFANTGHLFASTNSITPQMFGAKGDGITDDTKAIQNALNMSSYVYIPDGTYMIDAVSGGIKPKSNQKIVLSNNAVLKAITNGEKGYKIVYCEDVDNVHISGGKILGDNATHDPTNGGDSGFGIHVMYSRDITIENMEIADCWGDCIMLGYKAVKDEVSGEYYGIQSENIKIYNCKLHGGRRQGISVVSGLGVTIKDCEIYNITEKAPKSGIDIEPDWVGLAEDVLIEGCTIYDTSGASIIVTSEGKTKLVKITNCNLDSINCVHGDKTIIDNCNIRSLTARHRSNIFVSNCQLNKITTCGGSALVNNCMFDNGEETAVILSTLDGFSGDQSLITERLSFNHCVFKVNSTATKFLHLTVTTSYDFHQENNIEFYGCKIDLSESSAYFCGRLPGKELRIENCDIILKSGVVPFISSNQQAPARFIAHNSRIFCDTSLTHLIELNKSDIDYYIELINNEISDFTSFIKCTNGVKGEMRLINNNMSNESINGTNTLEIFSTSNYATGTVPTKTSQLTNDSGFITKNDIPETQAPDLSGYMQTSNYSTTAIVATYEDGTTATFNFLTSK